MKNLVEHPLAEHRETEEAAAFITEIFDETAQMGANNFEHSAFEAILANLRDGNCTPEEAVRRANEIRNSKSEYH